jgi:hypothetical protein
MLNRHNAELALKQAIQELLSGWTDKFVAVDGDSQSFARAEYYMDVLLNILPDFSAASSKRSNLSRDDKIAHLRRRLITILAHEQDLSLEKSFCDTVFTIQIALAKLFPFNKEASDGMEQAGEAWEETFSFETITRDTDNLIIFPESAVLTKASTQAYYQGQFGRDGAGNLRNFDNTPMSARQINSLQQQGINLQPPVLDDDDSEEYEAFDNEDETFEETNLGKYLGEKIGKVITFTTAFTIMFLCRGPVMFGASCGVGAITAIAAGPNGFHQGFLSTFLLGATAQALFVLTTAAGYAGGVLSENTANVAIDFLGTSTLPLILPTIVFCAAVHQAIHRDENISLTFSRMATNIFFNIPIKYSARLGEVIGNSISAIYEFLKNKLFGTTVLIHTDTPPSPSSHAIIMQTVAHAPSVVEEAEFRATPALENIQVINPQIPIPNDANDVERLMRPRVF